LAPFGPGAAPWHYRSPQHEVLATFYMLINAVPVNVFGGLNAQWNPLWHFR